MIEPSVIAAYVLAGGRSSRMGQDKALLPLAGHPLVQHMVLKLRKVTEEVSILSSRPELAEYAPLIADLHSDCGPIGGIEAALAHNRHNWTMIVPVDMPFLPSALLQRWSEKVLAQNTARVSLFVVDDLPQPALCLLHREVAPFIETAILREKFKLYPVLEEAAQTLAQREKASLEEVLLRFRWNSSRTADVFKEFFPEGREADLTEGQRSASHLWFANLNTPGEFNEAQQRLDALDG